MASLATRAKLRSLGRPLASALLSPSQRNHSMTISLETSTNSASHSSRPLRQRQCTAYRTWLMATNRLHAKHTIPKRHHQPLTSELNISGQQLIAHQTAIMVFSTQNTAASIHTTRREVSHHPNGDRPEFRYALEKSGPQSRAGMA